MLRVRGGGPQGVVWRGSPGSESDGGPLGGLPSCGLGGRRAEGVRVRIRISIAGGGGGGAGVAGEGWRGRGERGLGGTTGERGTGAFVRVERAGPGRVVRVLCGRGLPGVGRAEGEGAVGQRVEQRVDGRLVHGSGWETGGRAPHRPFTLATCLFS
jgi:hypothetical protein